MQVASWVEKVEDRFGHLAIPNVTRYLVVLQVVTYLLNTMSPGFSDTLLLDGRALHFGEVWRILTFMCVPIIKSHVWFVMYLWFVWTIGEDLEAEWGAAKINLYYLLGVIALTVVSLFFTEGSVRNDLLMMSLILPFGTVFPLEKILLYFILPVEARFMAMFFGAFLALAFVLGFLDRPVLVASILPYLLFFGPSYLADLKIQEEVKERRRRFSGE